jgi:hypothetical protein
VATQVFSEAELEGLRGFPEIDREQLVRYFTLTPTDEAFLRSHRGPGDRGGLGGVVGALRVPSMPGASAAPVRQPGAVNQALVVDVRRRAAHLLPGGRRTVHLQVPRRPPAASPPATSTSGAGTGPVQRLRGAGDGPVGERPAPVSGLSSPRLAPGRQRRRVARHPRHPCGRPDPPSIGRRPGGTSCQYGTYRKCPETAHPATRQVPHVARNRTHHRVAPHPPGREPSRAPTAGARGL